jgi:hypothetical protein
VEPSPNFFEESFPKFSRKKNRSLYQISSDNPQKDNFHNPIFGIDKIVTFGIFDSTILIKILSLKGVVDGERPLKFLDKSLFPQNV